MARATIALVAASLVCGAAWADTIYFADGSRLDGKVTQPNENCVALEAGGGRMVFRASLVAKIEQNDKTGSYNIHRVNPMAVKHNTEMENRFGVTSEQREMLIGMVDQLRANESEDRAAAKRQLIALQKDMDVFKFLEAGMDSFSDRVVPRVMETMAEIDTARAKEAIRSRATDAAAANRGKAIELLGKLKDAESLETVARGIVDEDEQVRISAANGLAEAGDRRATPVLLEALKSNDERVRNSAENALSKLWSTEGAAIEFDNPAQWETLWRTRSKQIANPIDPKGLKPLFKPEPDEHYYYPG